MKYILIEKELPKEVIKKYDIKIVEEDHYLDYFFKVDIHTRDFLNEVGISGVSKDYLSKEHTLCLSFLIQV